MLFSVSGYSILTLILVTVFVLFDRALQRVLVLAGDPLGGAFCVGGDFDALEAHARRGGYDAGTGSDLAMPGYGVSPDFDADFAFQFALTIPIVVAVNGAAAGGGMDMACQADIRIASDRARFAMSYVRRGLIPGDGGAWLLPRIVGLQKAKELAFSARIIEPEEARALGIVYDIVGEGEAVSQAVALANRFRNASSLAIAMTKNMLNQSFEHDLQSLLELEASAQAIANNSDYHRSAVARFLDKQPTLFDWEKQSG